MDILAMTEEFWFEKKPLVSCLMLTCNRFKPFKKALECYFKQSYTNKELVIVNSGDANYLNKVLAYINKHYYYKKITHVNCSYKHLSIGELRNKGLEYCEGEYVIVFDDDDIHHPERISKQIDLCLKSNIQGTLLKNFTAKIGWKEHQCSILRGLEGTLLFKNPKGEISYDDMNMGEDTFFISKLKEKGYNIAVIDEDFGMYKYVYHHSNTVGKKHFKQMIELNESVRK